jgi:hypothetical protein
MLAIAPRARADAIVTMNWQVSSDNGATWNGATTQVAQAQPSVLVRLRADWSGSETDFPGGLASTYFRRTEFDAVVSNAGPLDDITEKFSLFRGSLNGGSFPGMAIRVGSTLKMEAFPDATAPGANASWHTPFQVVDSLGNLVDFNRPVTIFQYRLALDGSLGTRDIAGVWRVQEREAQPFVSIGLAGIVNFRSPDAVVINNAAVRVVPSPGAWVAACLLPLALRLRRIAPRR